MDTATYDMLRHFADSWGLIYMFGILIAVCAIIFRPGGDSRAKTAAAIPLSDEDVRGDVSND